MSSFALKTKIIKGSLLLAVLVGAFLMFRLFAAHADFNKQINYQGKITNASSTPVADGKYDFTFSLYTASTGGTPLWSETWNATTSQVSLKSGLFSVLLGTYSSLANIDFNQTLYLGVNFNNDGEMTPRKLLGAVPAAFDASKLDGLSATQFLRNDQAGTLTASSTNSLLTINQTGSGNILDLQSASTSRFTVLNNGNVGIGDATPSSLFSVGAGGAFSVNSSGAITSVSGLSGATGSFDFSSTTLSLPNNAVNNINQIASSLKTGSSSQLVTGTSGTSGDCAQWNANGDLVTAGVACGGTGDAPGGSNGQIQYDASGTFAGATGLNYQASTTNVGIGTNNPTAKLSLTGGDFNQTISTNPVAVGNYSQASSSIYDVAISGDYAYLGDINHGLKVVNISNSSNPILVGSATTTSKSAYYVAKKGNYVYLTDGNLQIFNVSDPASPKLVSSYTTSGFAGKVQISGAYAYVADQNSGLEIINISDPLKPRLLGNYVTGGIAAGVDVIGKTAFVADTKGLHVLDVTDPQKPSQIGFASSTSLFSVTVSGSYAYASNYDLTQMKIFNISNPKNPTLVSTYNTGSASYAKDIGVSGSYAYIAISASGVQVVNISDPTKPTLVGKYHSAGTAYDISLSGTHAYLADGTGGLKILKLPGTTVPTLNAGTAKIGNLDVSQNANISGSLNVNTGLNIGGDIFGQSDLAVSGNGNIGNALKIGFNTNGTSTATTSAFAKLSLTGG
ncbi:MAG: hypothetical protein PF495_12370, partial [Spirochaetales bacterium]|nr:hypothetical protein [Spirochaetales bacterium]